MGQDVPVSFLSKKDLANLQDQMRLALTEPYRVLLDLRDLLVMNNALLVACTERNISRESLHPIVARVEEMLVAIQREDYSPMTGEGKGSGGINHGTGH